MTTRAEREQIVERILRWYDQHARDLPWRRADATAWTIMVSEFMLQQTPVARVLPRWQEWVERWPEPSDLAAASSAEVLTAWGRLGYPRRAQRLHRAARAITELHGGQVPSSEDELRTLPGVGDYTAAAVASFAHRRRAVVLDTNVRRVLARIDAGQEFAPSSPTRAERERAELFVPDEPERAARWAVASMELGALVCTARAPRCDQCPVRDQCAWVRAGRPAHAGPPRRGQAWVGTDRQCRGALLQLLRDAGDPLPEADLVNAVSTHPREQVRRCVASLLADGLIHSGASGIGLGSAG